MRNEPVQNIEHPAVREKFQSYPDPFRERLLFLRQLVFDTASNTDGIGKLEETLKSK